MSRASFRIAVLLCFAVVCLTSGAPRATATMLAGLVPVSTLPAPAEEEETHSSCKEATSVGERQRRERRRGRPADVNRLPQPRLASVPPLRGKPAGHRLCNGLLAPMLT